MGRAKQAMMEIDEYQWEETTSAFTCPKCGKLSDGHIEVPQVVDHHEYEVAVGISIQCIWCDKDFSAEFQKEASGFKITLHDYPETLVQFEPVYLDDNIDDDWYEAAYYYDQPDDPFSVFRDACIELLASIDLHGSSDGKASMNRMFFSQSFSIFEAFLCDTYLNLVFLDDDHQKLFTQKHKEMKDISFSISEMMKNSEATAADFIKKKLTQVIKATLFHNLDKTMTLYRIYKVNLFPEKDQKELLFKAVPYRHHAVHRNGCDLEGNKLDVYSKEYILSVVETMMESAKMIYEEIDKIRIAKLEGS